MRNQNDQIDRRFLCHRPYNWQRSKDVGIVQIGTDLYIYKSIVLKSICHKVWSRDYELLRWVLKLSHQHQRHLSDSRRVIKFFDFNCFSVTLVESFKCWCRPSGHPVDGDRLGKQFVLSSKSKDDRLLAVLNAYGLQFIAIDKLKTLLGVGTFGML